MLSLAEKLKEAGLVSEEEIQKVRERDAAVRKLESEIRQRERSDKTTEQREETDLLRAKLHALQTQEVIRR